MLFNESRNKSLLFLAFLSEMIYTHKHMCRCDGMADVTDSKSVVGDNVRVQVPPPALAKIPHLSYRTDEGFLHDVFHFAERDVRKARDVRLRRMMCLRA